jgi:hypothetical protein
MRCFETSIKNRSVKISACYHSSHLCLLWSHVILWFETGPRNKPVSICGKGWQHIAVRLIWMNCTQTDLSTVYYLASSPRSTLALLSLFTNSSLKAHWSLYQTTWLDLSFDANLSFKQTSCAITPKSNTAVATYDTLCVPGASDTRSHTNAVHLTLLPCKSCYNSYSFWPLLTPSVQRIQIWGTMR